MRYQGKRAVPVGRTEVLREPAVVSDTGSPAWAPPGTEPFPGHRSGPRPRHRDCPPRWDWCVRTSGVSLPSRHIHSRPLILAGAHVDDDAVRIINLERLGWWIGGVIRPSTIDTIPEDREAKLLQPLSSRGKVTHDDPYVQVILHAPDVPRPGITRVLKHPEVGEPICQIAIPSHLVSNGQTQPIAPKPKRPFKIAGTYANVGEEPRAGHSGHRVSPFIG